MATMTAYRLTGGEPAARLVEVEIPRPGPGEVLLKVAGVGLCGTDLHFLDTPEAFGYPLPFTLGHENAGWVEEPGPGVTGLAPGDPVVAVSSSFCGVCEYCRRGQTNHCLRWGWRRGRGFGLDGGLAPWLVVPERELVPLRGVDPRRAAPLTDAGTTSYHAVKRVLPRLVPGSTAVAIGVGGVGGYGVQYLRQLSPARVVAVDVSPTRLAFATEVGAHDTLPSDAATAEAVRELTGGHGADAVFDFVGTDDTMRTAVACARATGAVALVGAGGGKVRVGHGLVPPDCDVFAPMSSTIGDLQEVVALAEAGRLTLEAELFPLGRAAEAYARFRSGDLRSRAVVTPND